MKKEDKKEVNETSLGNKCPACGASISFDPKSNKWKCSYCGESFTIEQMQEHNNASSEKNNKKKDKSVEEDNTSYVKYRCDSCGAEIIADDQTSATFCVYCGNTAILKSKLDGKFAPDKIIPFKKTKEDAIESFKTLNKGRPLMPKFFNNEKNIEKIKGVYIPFWLYDVKVEGSLQMKCTDVTTWTTGDTHYTKTDTFSKIREGNVTFKRVPVDGSSRFDNDIMNTIEPFNYNDLIDYNHAYLSGFYAEKYDEEGDVSFKEVGERTKNSTTDIMKTDAPHYETTLIESNTLTPKEISKEYALLPVWMVNIKFNNKMYTFAMNGQTGEFVGNIPVDKKKAILIFSSLFILLTIIISLVGIFITGGF